MPLERDYTKRTGGMSIHAPYRFVLEISRQNAKEPLDVTPVDPDWEPALEWANLEAIRRDPNRPVVFDTQNARIEPAWSDELGSPYVAKIRVTVPPIGTCRAAEVDIPVSYFRGLARAASSPLVKSGQLADGEIFNYRICAYPQSCGNGDRVADGSLVVETLPVEIAGTDRSIDELLAGSSHSGPDPAEWLPVFIPSGVLEEAAELMTEAGSAETGGVLIGHFHRDSSQGVLFLVVTAQIPVQYARQELTRLTFTPETWAAVDGAISLRGRDEIYLGWWHTHPNWCAACDKRDNCEMAGKLSADFFSDHDVALHRAVFPRAYSVALVLSSDCHANSIQRSLYGWWRGMIASRGYHILGIPLAISAQMEGDADAEIF